jgi:hypothetical protein
MSGKRRRALEAQFVKVYGKEPSRSTFAVDARGNPCEERGAVAIAGNVFRAWKKRQRAI